MRLTGSMLVLLVLLVGCGDSSAPSDAPLTRPQVDAILAEADLEVDDLPESFDWERSGDNPAYVDGCAETAAELAGSAPGAVSTSRSDSYAGSSLGETGDLSDPSWLSVLGSATVFESEVDAAAAFASFDEQAFARCMEDGITEDIRGFEDETAAAGDIEAVEFDSRSENVGDESVLHSAYFSATVVAGFDDFEEIDVMVTRVGPAVLSIVTQSNAQNLSPGAAGDITIEIARNLADRVQATLD